MMNGFGGQGSSSESSDQDEDDLRFPDSNPSADEFIDHRRKRRKTGRDARESAALGIFGSESEDEGPGQRWKAKSLRGRGIGFTKSGDSHTKGEDNDEDLEAGNNAESEDEERGGLELEDTAGLREVGSRGLGYGGNEEPSANADRSRTNHISIERPLGMGFTPTSAKQPTLRFMSPAEEITTPIPVRPSFNTPVPASRQNGKAKGTPGPSSANPNSFAAKMMAKMGYVEGQGLGATGRGRLAPIETQSRPQGAGLGAVKEKTKQAKEEEKREAAFRGEILEDSEEEERKKRRKQKEKRLSALTSGASTPRGSRAKPKLKYQTAAEIEAAAEGLEVPDVLKSIIDATGKGTKLLTSTAGLMSSHQAMVPSETEAMKIARRARRDLEAFADEWSGLADRKKYFELQGGQLTAEIDMQEEEARRLRGLIDAVQNLHKEVTRTFAINVNISRWEDVTTKLETLEIEFQDEIEMYALQEVAVAAIHPLMKVAMEDWDPLKDPYHIVPYLQRLRRILGIKTNDDTQAIAIQTDTHHSRSHSKSTTHFETMMYTLWLPRIRTAIINTWDVHKPNPLIALIEAWRPLLPLFILHNIISQQIVQRLTTAIAAWNPRPSHKKRAHHTHPPHTWLFPWLPYLPEQHTSPKSPTGLLATIIQKFKLILQTWDLATGIPSDLPHWHEILSPTLFLHHLLPRLAHHLHTHLLIDPSDQDLAPLEKTLQWLPFFPASTLAHLLVQEFFPKWHATLHLWLTSSPNYDEIRAWYLWWKEQFPASLNALQPITQEWTKGLETITLALDLGPDAKTLLPPPAAGPTRPLPTSATAPAKPAAPPAALAEETTFRDVLEHWCAENNLLMLPLREAHAQTGLPLFRITASASLVGGVVVYLKGDVVWVRRGGRDMGGVWEPVGLGEGLVGWAGG